MSNQQSPQQQDETLLIILLSVFYGIERIFSAVIEILALNTKKLESLLILLLNPIQLEEIYFLIRHKTHHKYLSEGIIGQGCIILLFHIPINIIAVIWVLSYKHTTVNVGLLTFNLLALFVGPYIVSSFTLINSNFTSSSMHEHLQKLFSMIYSFFHFYTLFWSICLISKYNNLGLYLLAVYALLLVLFILDIRKRMKNTSYNLCSQVAKIFGFVIKQILHIVVERRIFDKTYYSSISRSFGDKLYNSMTFFEFGLKLYLFITSFTLLQQNALEKEEFYSFQVAIVVLLFASTLFLGIQVFIYIIPSLTFKKKHLEIDNLTSFLKDSFEKETPKENNEITRIKIFDKDYGISENQVQDLMKLVLYKYDKSVITYSQCLRARKAIKQPSFNVQINANMSVQSVIKVMKSSDDIIPTITEIYLSLSSNNDIQDLYQFQLDHHLNATIHTNYDDYHLTEKKIVNEKQMVVKRVMVQLLAYKNHMFNEQLCNPHLVYYDLFITEETEVKNQNEE